MIPLTKSENIGVLDDIREETLKTLVETIQNCISYYSKVNWLIINFEFTFLIFIQ